MISIKQFFLLLRLSHWSKAAFVLLGVFYSGSLKYLPDALLAAFAFCLISSAVYIYNDLQDREDDRLHPHKCRRPLASGEISFSIALSMLALLLVGGLTLAWSISATLAALLALYLLINLAYNHLLKNVPLADVLSIASGFMLRVLAGTIGIGLPISWWLTLMATVLSLFIALCKRRLEKKLGLQYSTRAVLDKYSFRSLDIMIVSVAISCFITYLIYTIYSRNQSFYFLLTLPFCAFGLWRFARLTTNNKTDNDDPVSLFINDNLSRFNFLCFLLLTLIALFK
ncbi:MAG: decaprenyl-phosphate phosphoribosyltransferase [Tatlockia sp.]|nr:decaprenyl-phosphate phosphoribosyltransferase [Tatlockia sp.]